MIKIYDKRGKKNYKEDRMVKAIQSVIEKRIEENPELADQFEPARNFEELEKMYNFYTSEEVKIQSETINNNNMAEEEELDDDFQETSSAKGGTDDDSISEIVDPFNREEPIVRDYVLDGGDLADPNAQQFTGQNDFEEPQSFDEAFELPDEYEPVAPQGGGGGGGSRTRERQPQPEKEEREPVRLNPDFDDMSSAKQKRQTKKFAKYIVETICLLEEKGFVWYANKDINDAKLVEYELNGVMDLSLLLSMEEGQQITVKQFFQMQCANAEQLAVIDEESKADLTDALTEVLLEKGIAPTPTQNLLLVAGKILVGQGVALMALKSQTNAVLSQLKLMKKQEMEAEIQEPEVGETYTPYEFQRTAPQPQPTAQPEPEADYEQEEDEDSDEMIKLLEANDPIGSEIQTLE
jgi:hypothetical protein